MTEGLALPQLRYRLYERLGHLRQVVPSALEFSFALVAEGTACEGAALRMEEGWGPQTSLRARLLDATGAQSARGR